MVKELGWTSLSNRRKEHDMALLYNIYNGSTVISKEKYLKDADYSGRHDHNKKIKLRQCSRGYSFNSFFPKAIRGWNQLVDTAVSASTCAGFIGQLAYLREESTCSHTLLV